MRQPTCVMAAYELQGKKYFLHMVHDADNA
jgi:hypothetical protein